MTSDAPAPDPKHVTNRRMDAICDRFEAAWISGTTPKIETYLELLPGDAGNRLLLELIKLDLDYRAKHGETPTPAEYTKRFPEHAALIRGHLDSLLQTIVPERKADEQINDLVVQFRRAWDIGSQPKIRDFVLNVAKELRGPLAQKLIPLDVQLRFRGSDTPVPDDYAMFGAGGKKIAERTIQIVQQKSKSHSVKTAPHSVSKDHERLQETIISASVNRSIRSASDPNHKFNRQVDAICDRFEAAWISGAAPKIETFLEPLPGDAYKRLLLELVKLDLEYCVKQGKSPKLTEYAKRFPEHAALIRGHLDSLLQTIVPEQKAKAAGLTDTVAGPPVKPPEDSSSRRIGPYKLLQKLGEGGMGAVYMADQLEPIKRRVALKLIKSGMDSKEVVARFEAERQALAMMDHQNIAKVLDAGITDEGTPYFAMELVQGMPITKYCDREKLSIADRLKLFVQVCRALQHAHQKGVIHRDIKPSNVLVTQRDGVPVAKVIDFGLAKALQAENRLTDKTLFTEIGQVCGTLEYMSPEQAEMNELGLDTRTDVYSLGVLLYELLTGSTPLGHERVIKSAFHRVLQMIITEEAPRPSRRLSESGDAITGISDQRRIEPRRLSGILKRELDWIALKALEKDRNRRYDGAGTLGDDVQHYLDGDVVTARPPSTGYRLRKAIRKHKTAFVSGTVFVLLLLAGLIGTGTMWSKARVSEANAQKEADKAKAAEAKATDEATKARAAEAETKLALSDAEVQRQLAVTEADKAITAERNARASEAISEREKENAQRNLAVAEKNAYYSDMLLAQRDWEESNIGHLMELLDRHRNRDHVKGFEWHYWERLTCTALHTLKINDGHHFFRSLSFSRDGQRIVSGGEDGTVRVWDAETGQEMLTLRGHKVPVNSVSFSLDGKRIVSGDGDRHNGTVKLWDVSTGKAILTLNGHSSFVRSVSLSPDGKRIVSGGGGAGNAVKVWDAQTGKETLTLKGSTTVVLTLSFSPDGKRIVSGSEDGTVKLWDAEAGEEMRTLKAHSHWVNSVSFSPNGKQIVSGGDNTVKLWDAATGEEIVTLKGHNTVVRGVSFSPNGKQIVSGGDNTVNVWDAETGQEVIALKGHKFPPSDVRFSPDGKRIITGSNDGTVKVWDAQTGQHTLTLKGHTGMVSSVSFSPDGDRIVSGSIDGTARVWQAESGQDLMTITGHTGQVHSVSFSPDGKRIASAGYAFIKNSVQSDEIKLWDAETGQEIRTFHGHSDWVHSVSFSPDGKRIASACSKFIGRNGEQSDEIKLWDAETGEEIRTLKGHTPSIFAVSFSPDGKRIVSAGDSTVKLWDAETGEEMHTLKGHSGFVRSVSFSPDGKRIVSGADDATPKLWDVETGQEILTLKGHRGSVTSVSFSPDGKRIVTGSNDKTLKLWDAETGQEALTLNGHREMIGSVSFSPDGKRIISGGGWFNEFGEIKVWDARPWTTEQRVARRAAAVVRGVTAAQPLPTPVTPPILEPEQSNDAK